MIDLNGREWLEAEYLQLKHKGLITEEQVVKVEAIKDGICQRCLNESDQWFGTFKYQDNRIRYCRKCLDFSIITDQMQLYRSILTPSITPNAYQLDLDFQLSELQKRASEFVKELMGKKETGIIWAVCGAGKTEMMFEAISEALKEHKRVCWAIPRADVVVELVPRLKIAFPQAKVVGLFGRSTEKRLYGDIVISTVHQLVRFYHAFEFLIIDEVDAFPYTFDEMLPRLAKKACSDSCTTVYLSATPSITDQQAIKKGQLKCCLIPARYHLQPLDVPQFKWCGCFEKEVAKSKLPKVVSQWIKKKIKEERRALIFVPTINSGHRLKKALEKHLKLLVDFVYASDDQRLEKVKRFKEGQGQFLITTMILERGVTIVDIDVAIMGAEHEVYEESALVQISGRVGRSPKYPHGEIIFFHDGITQSMDAARNQINKMNRSAIKQQLLKNNSN